MIKRIKQKFHNVKLWLKKKWNKTKAIILLILCGTALAAGVEYYTGPEIPEHLKLRCPKEKILFNKEIKEGVVQYLYASEAELPMEENEIHRTKNTQIFKVRGKDKYEGKFFAGEPFYQDVGQRKWFLTEMATTTKDAFIEQTKKTVWKQIFETAYAATTTIYSGFGDGYVYKFGYSGFETWDQVHDAETASAFGYTGDTQDAPAVGETDTDYYIIFRAFFPIETSDLPDDSVISAATFNVYVASKQNDDNDGDDFIRVVQTSQASPDSLGLADYDQCGSVNNPEAGAPDIDIGSISTAVYNTWTLNATGTGWISTSSFTYLGLREGHDALDNAYVGATNTENSINSTFSDYGGNTRDPYLSITFTSAEDADITYGTRSAFDTGYPTHIDIAELSTDKFVVCMADAQDSIREGECRIGTVSGTSITYATPTEFCADVFTVGQDVCKIDSSTFVIVYMDDVDSDNGYVRVGVVDGSNQISYGTAVQISTGDIEYPSCILVDTNTFIVGYNHEGNSDRGSAIACVVSATSTVSCGTVVVFDGGVDQYAKYNACEKLDTDSFICAYEEEDSNDGYIVAGEVSGTSTISMGVKVNYETSNPIRPTLSVLDTDKFVLAYTLWDVVKEGRVIVGTVTGTSTINLGTTTVFESSQVNYTTASVGIDTTHIVIGYSDDEDGGKGKTTYCTVDFTAKTLTVGEPETFDFGFIYYKDAALISSDKIAIAYQDYGTFQDGFVIIGDTPSEAPPEERRIIITE